MFELLMYRAGQWCTERTAYPIPVGNLFLTNGWTVVRIRWV